MKIRCCRSPESVWPMWMRPRVREDHDVRCQRASRRWHRSLGLTFTVGDGTSDTALTFTGTVANVNAAWHASTTWRTRATVGSDTLVVNVDDQGNTGSGGAKADSKSIVISVGAVNNPPQLTLPGSAVGRRGHAAVDHGHQRHGCRCRQRAAQDHDVGCSGSSDTSSGHGSDIHGGRWHERRGHDLHRYSGEHQLSVGSGRLPGQCQLQRCRYAEHQRGRSGQHGCGWCKDGYEVGGDHCGGSRMTRRFFPFPEHNRSMKTRCCRSPESAWPMWMRPQVQ